MLELGARKIVFFEWNEVHSSPRLKHENVFYRVRKGHATVRKSDRVFRKLNALALKICLGLPGLHSYKPGKWTGKRFVMP